MTEATITVGDVTLKLRKDRGRAILSLPIELETTEGASLKSSDLHALAAAAAFMARQLEVP